MTTSTSPIPNDREDDEPMMAAESELVVHLGTPRTTRDDAYADNELVTRHERTERAIRQAQEQQ